MEHRCRDGFFALVTLVVLPACALSLSGYVADEAYHPVKCDKSTCLSLEKAKPDAEPPPAVEPVPMKVGNYGWNVVRENEKFTDSRPVKFQRAWLEFNDQGQLHVPEQLIAIQKAIEGLRGRPIFIVTFIHGWHHNASGKRLDGKANANPKDWRWREPNAVKADYYFSRLTDQVRRLHEQRGKPAPSVLAIYIGWRGEASSLDPINLFTIANRANAADAIGSPLTGKLRSTLIEISKSLEAADPSGRMLVSGHSLGGRALAKAFLSDVEKIDAYPLGKNSLIALLEPAISADCFSGAVAVTDPVPKPYMISFTSRDDTALIAYEWGRLLPFWIPACDECAAGNKTAIGNFEEYITHKLNFVHETEDGDSKEGVFVWRKPKTSLAAYFPNANAVFVIDQGSRPWFQQPGRRHLAYATHERCVDGVLDHDCVKDPNDLYTMRLHETGPKTKPRSSRFWNIQTDRNTIDSEDQIGSPSGLHNFVSTNLARLFAEFLYPELTDPPALTRQ